MPLKTQDVIYDAFFILPSIAITGKETRREYIDLKRLLLLFTTYE